MLRLLQHAGRRLLVTSSVAYAVFCTTGVLDAHQLSTNAAPNTSTEELDQRYGRARTEYDAELGAVRGAVGQVRPELLQAFDRNTAAWSAYIAAECDDMPYKLFKGGSAAADLALRCRLSLYQARLEVLKRDFAPLRH